MNCTICDDSICRKQQSSCNRKIYDSAEVIDQYKDPSNSEIVLAAAKLEDSGRGGTLSRMEEIVAFANLMNYKRLGLAYFYGMKQHAKAIETILTGERFVVSAVSCSLCGLKQSEVNAAICILKVSCNPMGQAQQLNAEKVDLTLFIGICLGHDILLNRHLDMDFTTLIVKDRKFGHATLLGI